MVLLLACGCGTASPHAAGTAASGDRPRHVIDLFGGKPPPQLPELTAARAAGLPKLGFSFGPVYGHGRLLGIAVRFGGCGWPSKGAVVTGTAATVTVAVYGSRFPRPRPHRSVDCAAILFVATFTVRLAHPLGHRTEIPG